MPTFIDPQLTLFAAKLTRSLLADYGLRATPTVEPIVAKVFAEGWDLSTATFLVASHIQGRRLA